MLPLTAPCTGKKDELENGIEALIVKQRCCTDYEQAVKELVLERDDAWDRMQLGDRRALFSTGSKKSTSWWSGSQV